MININRDYTISDADLTMFVSNLVQTMTRDIAEFADYGVTAANVTTLQSLGNQFELFPPDTFYLADVGIATADKDLKRTELLQATRKITNRALAKWGVNSAQYNKFGVKGLSDMTDREILATARLVVMTATDFLSQLASEGLTQDIIDDYAIIVQQFESKMNDMNTAIADRDIKTRERIAMGNQLYALVSKYCTYGKTIWENVNEAKYNDYVIYTGVGPGSLSAPQNFMFDPLNYDFRWSAVPNATSYELQSSTDGINYIVYWNGSDLMCPYEESPNQVMYFRVRARNAGGLGGFSSVIEYDFAVPLTAPLNLSYISQATTFTWSEVVGAEIYEFQYRQQTNPVWSSLNAGNVTTFYHADPVGNYIARVRAVSSPNYGPWSAELPYSVTPPQPD